MKYIIILILSAFYFYASAQPYTPAETADTLSANAREDFGTIRDEVTNVADVLSHAVSSFEISRNFNYKQTAEWQRFKIMRAVGWSAFGAGLATAAFGGLLQAATLLYSGPGDFAGPGLICVVAGGSLAVASVPVLIIGYHNKHKAEKMALNFGISHISTPSGLISTPHAISSNKSAPALGLSLTF